MQAQTPSRLEIARRRSRLWGKVGVLGFVVLLIAAATGYYFANVHEELYFRGTGRIVDCGAIFDPNDSPLSVANCDGANRGDVIGLALMVLVAAIGLSAMVLGTLRERAGMRSR